MQLRGSSAPQQGGAQQLGLVEPWSTNARWQRCRQSSADMLAPQWAGWWPLCPLAFSRQNNGVILTHIPSIIQGSLGNWVLTKVNFPNCGRFLFAV